ncbi:MMPL family transporter [Bdellovibrionota bacterium FG-1]
MQSFVRFILRRAGIVALLGTLLAGIGSYYSVQLFKNLRTDFEELLPTTARSVIDLNEVSHRLESIDSLGILVFSKHPEASKRFVKDLAQKLSSHPKTLISSVEYKIDQEVQFFKEREALYMDLSDLIKVRDYIQNRIEFERQLYNPLNIFSNEEIAEPKLDFKALRQKYDHTTSAYSRFPGGYYATPDGTKRVILVYKPGGGGMDESLALKAAVEKSVSQLNPSSYTPDLEVHYTGGVQDQIEEHAALIEDLALSTVIVTILVSLGMWLFFRNFRAVGALLTSLFMGTFWTFGVSYFLVGYLNANSAFMGSIVIGNGINFGIIFLARYLEERRLGHQNTRAIRTAMIHTATSTWTAALAAALSYGSLILTSFRGFRQFGIIGLIGMILCWVSAFTLLPAYLTLADKIYPLVKKGTKPPKAIFANALARLIQKRSRFIWAVSFVLTIISLAMFTRYTPKILETDLSRLRNKHSMESGSVYFSHYLDDIFQRYLSPLVVLPKSREDTPRIAAALRLRKAQEGERSLFASIQTMDDFIPKDQFEKIKVLKEIRKILSPKMVRRLSDEDQKRVTEFLTDASLTPIRITELPALVLAKFTEKDGTIGKLVLVEPPLTHETWEGENIIKLIHDLRERADSVRPGTAVAGMLAITSDMIESVAHDGPRATLFAFLAVVILVIFLFRNLQSIALTLFALILGVLWLAGLILGFGFKINFLNFIALPITFGIGVDYGVNIFQRYREEKGGGILPVIRTTGGAVALCSFTTMTGYMSLLLASNQGFVSFGTLAVAGELTCVTAALVALPAYLMLRKPR